MAYPQLRAVGNRATSSGGNPNNTTVPLPTGVLAGDLLLLVGTVFAGTSDGLQLPAGYTLVMRTDQKASLVSIIVASKIHAAGDTAPLVSLAASYPSSWRLYAFSNVDNSQPVDIAAKVDEVNITNGTLNVPSVNTLTAQALQFVVAAHGSQINRTITPNSPLSEVAYDADTYSSTTTTALANGPALAGAVGVRNFSVPTSGWYRVVNVLIRSADPSSGGTPVSFNGTVPNQSATVGSAFSLNLSGYFSGSLTPFGYSPVAGSLTGTGLSLNTSTGVISGTPTGATTISGIQVRATDAGSNTAQTNAFNIVVSATAQVPQGTVTIGTVTSITNNSATVSFTYSASDQTGFQYSLNGTSNPVAVPSGTSPISLTGLSPSTAYTVQVRAVNATGNGVWSTAQNFTTTATPQVPQGTFTVGTITVTSSTASVPYTYSASDQTSIQYTLNGGTTTFTASASPQALSGLSANTTYTIQFRAINATGSGAWSTGVQFTTSSVATASFTLTALANNAGVIWATTANVTVDVYNPSTGALVVRKTNLTTDSNGNLTVADAVMSAATTYTAVITIGSARGVVSVTTS